MSTQPDVAGVVITGVYGAGKSSVAAEIAVLLEARGLPYGALDLDWLTWFDVDGLDEQAAERVFLANLRAVVDNYRTVGVKLFVLALSVRDRADLDRMVAAAGFPLRTVRLEVAPEEIERRLRSDPTTGRRDDLRVAREWLAAGTGVGVEDLTIANEGPIHDVAEAIVAWLGWS